MRTETTISIQPPSHISFLTLCVVGIGITPLSLPAQSGVPVLVLEEPTPKPIADRIRLNPVRPLPWSATRELLAAEDLPAPARPATFTLTPRDPYEMPGGVIRLVGDDSEPAASWWQPAVPEPTGSARIDNDNRIFVHLLNMKADYQYALDISASSFEPARLVIGVCDNWYSSVFNEGVDGPQHVIIKANTDQDGDACVQLRSPTDHIYVQRVTVSELGPRPTSRFSR